MVNTEEEFQMTDDEARRIKEALKNKEFMDLLLDYAKEISDPVNKKKYEEEIIAMEKERGQDVRLLKPQSGFVIKTVRLSDNLKVFLNICTSPEVGEHEIQHVKGGAKVSLPHSVSPEREDIDKAGNRCIIYDVCFNPKSFEKGLNEVKFRETMVDSAFDTIESRLAVKLDRKNKKFPKMKYKGQARPLIIRSQQNHDKSAQPLSESNESLSFPYPTTVNKEESPNKVPVPKDEKPRDDEPVVPKCKIIHRGYFDMTDFTGDKNQPTTIPKELVVQIELPMADSANGIDLDIFSQELILNSEKPSYHLNVKLPHKIDEEKGKAQFDKSKKLLVVTLPLIKPECPKNVPVLPHEQSLVQEVVENGRTESNFVEPSTKEKDTTDSKPDDFSAINVEKSEEEKNVENFNLEDMQFDTLNFQSMPLNARLPPYTFDQTEESMTVVLKITNVQVQNISLGFNVHQVCFSAPQESDNPDSSDWNMVIRLDDHCQLDKDECGFELFDDRIELRLKKKNEGFWERFFVGVSETSLQMEVFLTEMSATELLDKLKSLNVDKLPRATIEDEDEKKGMAMEKHLERLLEDQEKQINIAEKNFEKVNGEGRVFTLGSCSDEESDINVEEIDLMDLVDDVIDETSPLTSPTDGAMSSEEPYRGNRILERSISYDNYHPSLRSILKRSKSDGSANRSDGSPYERVRSMTYSDGNVYSEPENDLSRRRNKSVSFHEEPTVFEFIKMTKWEWKQQELKKKKQGRERKHKEKRKGKSMNSDQTASSTDDDRSTSNISEDGDKGEAVKKQEKHGRKWRKAEKKRRRQNSESRSEEENDVNRKCEKKGKRKNKKNRKGSNSNIVPNSEGVQGEIKTKLNNPLIFELD